MKKIIVSVLVLVGLMFISACDVDPSKLDLSKVDTDKIIKCDSPYIRVGAECCVDQDDNKICDKDEIELEQLRTKEEEDDEESPEKDSCADECSKSYCKVNQYVQCVKQSDGCMDEVNKGLVIGKCDVECITDKDCKNDEECSIYMCVSNQQEEEEEPEEEESDKYLAPSNVDLSDFPYPFIQNKKFYGALVVGDKASAESVISISDISTALQYSAEATSDGSGGMTIEKIEIPASKLSSEVSDLSAQNLIIVGYSDCVGEGNYQLKILLGAKENCKDYFTDGEGVIELFDTGAGNVALIVSGGTPMDTRNAAQVLANYMDYDLSGTKVSITRDSSGTSNVRKLE